MLKIILNLAVDKFTSSRNDINMKINKSFQINQIAIVKPSEGINLKFGIFEKIN